MAALRRFFDESLCLRVVAEGAKSISYEAQDVVLVLDWSLDHSTAPADAGPRGDVVLLVDEIDAVQAALETCGVRCTAAGGSASISFAVPDGPRFVMLSLSDECLMWPSVGWRAGPSAVVYIPPRSAP
ncbi:hypothetical protein BG844_00420 [Couchioplanes caeruleus subsp. caeruleus]|uniref:VOC domain-containing protein n=1 Tax=Couchioplanes caeruleus subsp. caeruleus TaxID=56427 RepID=A0A1K0H3G3_9ACTN|nr:hypothetical protein BG844_00420 [Couchioplanes caeruleus subsp. caeruleus]